MAGALGGEHVVKVCILIILFAGVLAVCSRPAAAQYETPSIHASKASPFHVVVEPDYIVLKEDGQDVLRYVKGEILAEGVPEDRRRSTYVHPLYSPDGQILTEDFPADHHHHRGMSWMWLKVVFDGQTADLWTLKGIRQKYRRLATPALLKDKATLHVRSQWVQDETGRTVINEDVYITAHKAKDGARILDYRLDLAAVDVPVTIGVSGTGYSGFGIRFIRGQEAQILTAEGPISEDENRLPHRWADYSSILPAQDHPVGLTIMNHRENPGSPPGWTLRFYGYMNPAFTSRTDDYTIQPGSPLQLKYRVYIHPGRPDPRTIEVLYNEFNKL